MFKNLRQQIETQEARRLGLLEGEPRPEPEDSESDSSSTVSCSHTHSPQAQRRDSAPAGSEEGSVRAGSPTLVLDNGHEPKPLRKTQQPRRRASSGIDTRPGTRLNTLAKTKSGPKQKLALSTEGSDIQRELHLASKAKHKYDADPLADDHERLAREALELDMLALSRQEHAQNPLSRLAQRLTLVQFT
eukprot:comp17607_c0_seq1/m.17284 comp17607_c0_seq1/g.17284  ORF comp17607_c0_seq1/g.17284 comp17607_c0_seq1/m.17284 type:complete len:189 (-) comp17607_c0_seq1:268-834(-)